MQRRAQGPQQCGHRPVLGPEADLLRGERGIADPFPCPADREYRVVALVTGESETARSAGADCVISLPFDPKRFTEEMVRLVE